MKKFCKSSNIVRISNMNTTRSHFFKKGLVNLVRHIENIKKFGVPVVVAINKFYTDTDAEIKVIEDFCHEMGAEVSVADIFVKGGESVINLISSSKLKKAKKESWQRRS